MNDRLQTLLQAAAPVGPGRNLDVRLQEAAGHQLNHAEFLELILQDELLVRNQRLIDRRVKAAQFRELKALDDFDLGLQSVDPTQADLRSGHLPLRARDCGTCCCSVRRERARSFLAQAIGYLAIKQGLVVLYRSIFDVVRDFLHDEAARRTRRRSWPDISSPTC